MGMAKHAAMEHEERRFAAASWLKGLGTLNSCEIHGNLFDGDGDLDRGYRAAAAAHKRGELGFSEGLTQKEATDLVKEAYEDNAGIDYCPICAKHERE